MWLSMYKINEIFYSLQGEGANAGTPAVFIRFAGCNLCCPFCDTDFDTYTEMSAEEIIDETSKYPTDFIVLTGGEPALQVDKALVDALHSNDYVIAIETNGTCPLPKDIDWVTVSPKEGSRVVLTEADEVKVVYTGQDVEQYLDIEAECHYLQPCWKGTKEKSTKYKGKNYKEQREKLQREDGQDGGCPDNREEVIRYCMEHPQWSMSVQLHKLLGIK